MNRSYYSNTICLFLQDYETLILGELTRHHAFSSLDVLQKNAWIEQIKILKNVLSQFEAGMIYFEFSIPRMGKRVDNILIINDLIFVLEFKIGENQYQKHSIEQVVDYCLDLQNFHEGSHTEKLVPILVSTKAETIENIIEEVSNLFQPLKANQENLGSIINRVLSQSHGTKINTIKWENSIYKPTPTIIEAAQALYKGHNVKEISKHDAGAINLTKTSDRINSIIETAKSKKKKSICFLTGVPGAGKTLAGLNIANQRKNIDEDEHAVFLSGNGPLVYVLREALTRDAVKSSKENGQTLIKKTAERDSHAFIQNIHHFRDDNYNSPKAPVEKVVVFDEAQRAWAKEQVSAFMKKKNGIVDFDMSEPQFLISVMDRHSDWCTIICLIGGGQEINTGEAGVSEWLIALKNKFPYWDIHFSDIILYDKNYLSDDYLRDWLKSNAISEKELHLSVPVRSFRSEKISELVHELLETNSTNAKNIFSKVKSDFPIYLTRDLAIAKKWLVEKRKGSERIGIVGSSGAKRLRPLGIDVKNEISAPLWFLNSSEDVRSSNYLEDVATEFHIQGLEIDYVCLAWDINFYFKDGQWIYRSFEGTKWKEIRNPNDRTFLINTYRVLLTRARQGMIILVPYGDSNDPTRNPEYYDSTFEYLKNIGFDVI
ncbi:DUF2075 domain-containing protein [soil metagenome]